MTSQARSVKAVVASGLVPEGVLRQFQKWGMLPPGDIQPVVQDITLDQAAELFRRVREEGEEELIKDTDLDIVAHYVRGQEKGRLYVATVKNGKPSTTYVDVHFYKTKLGEYVLPWRDENLRDLLLDPTTYLKPTGGERVYFADVRDLYFGEQRTFVVCSPAPKQDEGSSING